MPKVERQRLHDTVVEHLRRFIVEGVLEPGKKLNERELCETLGISRTPLARGAEGAGVGGTDRDFAESGRVGVEDVARRSYARRSN